MKPIDPRLLREAGAARRFVAATVAIGFVVAGVVLAQAALLAHVLAEVVDRQPSLRELAVPLAAFAATWPLRAGLVWAQERIANRSAVAVKSELRARLGRAVLARGPAGWPPERSGRVAVLAGPGLDALDGYFARFVPQLVLACLVPPTVLVVVAWSDWRSAVVLAVTLPLVPVFMVLIGLATRQRTERQWRALGALGGHFLDVVEGLPTLRAFGRARHQKDVLRAMADDHRRTTMGTLRLAFLSSLALELLATLGTALVAVTVGLRLLGGHLTLGTAFLVLLLTPEAYLPLRRVGASFHASADGLAAADAALDLLEEAEPTDTTETVRQGRPPAQAVGPTEMIRLEHVTLRHTDRAAPALDDVSLALEPGEHVALVGPNGSGKSTIQHLLLGLARPGDGRVLVGDRDLQDLDQDAWRAQIAWVPQQPHLFAASLADNLRLAAPGATDAELRGALCTAQAEELTRRLPRGLDTPIGAGGVAVSAGERRRIALARALLRDSPLVLLDEPTANLDGDTEAAVLDALWPRLTGRTVLAVDHRGAVAARCDRVLRLDGGRLLVREQAGDPPVAADPRPLVVTR